MIILIQPNAIQCRVRGHTYVVLGPWCPDSIAHSIQTWADNPTLNFTDEDGINLAIYLGTLAREPELKEAA